MRQTIREIIEIDEERCTGCGQCVLDCAEGAIAVVDGKARVIADIYCDGLGACLSGCPEDALRIIRREAVPFDEEAVREHLARQSGSGTGACGESGAGFSASPEPPDPEAASISPFTPLSGASRGFSPLPGSASGSHALNSDSSTLTSSTDPAAACEGFGPLAAMSPSTPWPVKIRLMSPQSPFLRGADLLVAADCAAFAAPDFHSRLAQGKVMLIGCPKFEGADALSQKLAAIFTTARPGSLLVARMEVPCCKPLAAACVAAAKAARAEGVEIALREAVIGRDGSIQAN